MIDKTAIIDANAEIANDVEIGPYTIIGAKVKIDSGSWIGPHVVIQGPTTIGKNNKIFQFSSIGEAPQDKKYFDEDTQLIIGDDNLIRESVTINRGTVQGGNVTRIGSKNWIMAYCHIAHDCIVGNDIVFANCASLAGHVTIKDHVILGGFTLVHQFANVGEYSFSARASGIMRDVPPYVVVSGYSGSPSGINIEGLKRHQFSDAKIRNIKNAYKLLYKSKLKFDEALVEIEKLAKGNEEIEAFYSFLSDTKRGIVR